MPRFNLSLKSSIYPDALLALMAELKKFPGVGNKTAERYAIDLLDWKKEELALFAKLLHTLKEEVKLCKRCGCLERNGSCPYCDSERINSGFLCVTASIRDVIAIESIGIFKGCYHVIGGLLSPLQGKGPDSLGINSLKSRLENEKIDELVIAFDPTIEGDATALFLKRELSSLVPTISRLALGLPMGSSLNYIDGGTLSQAFSRRNSF
ncbi:Recombination protein recR [Criblamydia sequanensis CRIB-18]|uniref:Recombination protein RecR n=1 Tax=Candidatus Criblamydia sequanensis CRIB-18 TaxID=1437425 RepID=A0A090D1Z1_9BACT|nr:Recombination protein recR [Criblamydia sequanensis CRIB-18]